MHYPTPGCTKTYDRQYTSNSSKSKDLKAIKRLLKRRTHEKGEEEWEPSISFYDRSGSSQPRDFLTKVERSKIREAALDYGSIPAYGSVTPRERSRWKRYLSMRFSKPVSKVTVADSERANGWKIPTDNGIKFLCLDCR